MSTTMFEDQWIRDVGGMVALWFVALTISSAFLVFYGDVILTLLG